MGNNEEAKLENIIYYVVNTMLKINKALTYSLSKDTCYDSQTNIQFSYKILQNIFAIFLTRLIGCLDVFKKCRRLNLNDPVMANI